MGEEKRLKARVAHKHKTEAEWYLDVYTAADSTTKRPDPFIPLNGELIIFDADENHKKRLKIGDGKTDVIALPFSSATNLQDGYGINSIAQTNAATVGENSAAFGVSELQTNEDGTVKTEVRVVVGYDPKKGDVITRTYGTSGAGSGSTGDLTPEEEPTAESVMYYKDGNQILSVFSIDFNSTGALGDNSFTAGENTLAAAKNSNATGWNTYAGANYTSTEGSDTIALGEDAHTEGLKNMSIGQATHTEGMRNTAEGKNSHLEGLKNHTSTNAVNSHVEGSYNNCRSSNTHMEGTWNVAIGSAAHSHIEGEENITDAINSHIEGSGNTITGSCQDSTGKNVYSENAHIEGNGNTAKTLSSGQIAKNVHIEGQGNTATAENVHVEGQGNTVSGKNGHGEGSGNTITSNGQNAHVGGMNSIANGNCAFVHGNNSKVFSANGIAIGIKQFSRQDGSISLGYSKQFIEDLTTSTDQSSVLYSTFTSILNPEDRFSAAVGRGSVSIGTNNVSHRGVSLGFDNYTAGDNTNFAIAIGSDNEAKAKNAVAIGKGNKATQTNQQVYGVYNKLNNNAIYMVGHGTATDPANAFIIDTNNNGRYRGSLYVNADSAGNNGKLVATVEYVDKKISGSSVEVISEEYILSLFA